jgi:hypothetical protein
LLAAKHLPAEPVDRLLRVLWNIENEPNVNGLIAATLVERI